MGWKSISWGIPALAVVLYYNNNALCHSDCEQMLCVKAYMAQQPDELSLEKAEVILVHQDSSDSKIILHAFCILGVKKQQQC